MNLLPHKNTLKLLRIPFSFFLMPVFILAASQANYLNYTSLLISFLIIHLLVYPASNGYNSYIDRDESPIGGLEKPPAPTLQLFYLTILMDVVAVLLSLFLINILFSVCVLIYIMASRAYSSKQIRLKKYPIAGFLTVIIFQGGFTFLMCSMAINNQPNNFSYETLLILCATSLQIAGAYPLTQIYQHNEDYADGVITLSYRLGYRGTFIFTAIMFALCNFFYFLYFAEKNKVNHFFILQLFFIPVIIYFLFWFIKVINNTNQANFKNTMRMNFIASVCMNSCFVLLFLLNHIK